MYPFLCIPPPQDCFSCNYPSMTWGTWLVAASLIASPFWFNPLTFDLTKVQLDFVALGEVCVHVEDSGGTIA